MSQEPRFFILRGGAIGDFIVTLPAINALRQRWPHAYIELAGYPRIAQFAQAKKLVDKVVSLDRADMARLFSHNPEISAAQKKHIASFAFILSYLYDPTLTVKANLLASGAKKVLSCSPLIKDVHAIDHLFAPLQELGIRPKGNEQAHIRLSPEHVAGGQARMSVYGPKVALIHPGSGSPGKNWPLPKFLEIGARIKREFGWAPVFALGEADNAIRKELTRLPQKIRILSDCSLIELAECLSACSLYVGNDSGVTHIAAALGKPVTAIFGPTDPNLWAPRGRHVSVVRSESKTPESLASLDVNTVWQHVVSCRRHDNKNSS
ncbi:MAG: glycosyltransferase family 9 protein [Lentisphaerae bacterium]|nr:glycosyltransferase family 9 protein [Lentisphaerota bacterium]